MQTEKQKEAQRRYRARHPDRVRASTLRWRADNADRYRTMQRRSKACAAYGLSTEEFDALLSAQAGKCALCGEPFVEGRYQFHVDHCHATGGVRGLLHPSCNLILGHAQDSVPLLQKAAAYLESRHAG